MNASATLAFPQMFLVWTLLGVLVAWMFLCLFLALRPLQTRKKRGNGSAHTIGSFSCDRLAFASAPGFCASR